MTWQQLSCITKNCTIQSFLMNKMLRACFSSAWAFQKMYLTRYKVYGGKKYKKKCQIWCCTNLLIFIYYVLFDRRQQSIYISVFISVHWNQPLEAKMQLLSQFLKLLFCCCFVSLPMLLDISLKGMSGKKITSDLCRSLPMSSKMSTGLFIFI